VTLTLKSHSRRSISTERINNNTIAGKTTGTDAGLATRMEDKLEEIAEQADRIYEIGDRAIVAATASKTTQLMQQPNTSQTAAEAQMIMLSKQIATLTVQMAKLTEDWNQKKARNRTRSYSRS